MNGTMIAAAGPPALVAAVEIVMLMLSLVGDHPRWQVEEVNLSEAAAIRDFAEVARQLERGESPNLVRVVREGMIDAKMRRLTPLEAATIAEREEIAGYLLEHGARPSGDEWLRLRCHAETSGLDDLAAVMDTARPAGVAVACDEVPPLID